MAARPQPPTLSPPCGPRPLPSVLGNSLAATAGPCGGAEWEGGGGELQGKLTPSSPDSLTGPPPPSHRGPPRVGPEGPSPPHAC